MDLQQIVRSTPAMHGCQAPKVDVLELDLASLKSVKRFCKQFSKTGLSTDVVICNAGIMKPPKRIITEDGLEGQFQVKALVLPHNELSDGF